MNFLASAKGKDITTWRAAEDFAVAYRQSVLDIAASGSDGTAESVYSASVAALENSVETHRTLIGQLDRILDEGATSPPAGRLQELTTVYYDVLYHHMATFHSAPAFYQKSMDFVDMLGSVIMARSKDQLGLFARHLPNVALVALGPAGRREYSPRCPLQLLLVHGEAAASQLQTINLLCQTLHDEFEATGLTIDPLISPRNPEWRGSISTWQQRCDNGVHLTSADSLIHILQLTDQYLLSRDEEIAREFKEMTTAVLRGSRPTQANLIVRMESLSHGIGIMGGLKLERSGATRGLFNLLDHGLRPLSSALSALALIRESNAVSSYDRVLDLLKRRELDVELAEKILETWHTLHELRLWREQTVSASQQNEFSSYLNPDDLTSEQRHSLKTALTSVAAIQRHVGIVFSGLGE